MYAGPHANEAILKVPLLEQVVVACMTKIWDMHAGVVNAGHMVHSLSCGLLSNCGACSVMVHCGLKTALIFKVCIVI